MTESTTVPKAPVQLERAGDGAEISLQLVGAAFFESHGFPYAIA